MMSPRGSHHAAVLLLLLVLAAPAGVSAEEKTGKHMRHDVTCETTEGALDIELHDEWSPLGVKRFLELVDDKFFENMLIYRILGGFVMQFGVAADPKHHSKWDDKTIPDERDNVQPFKMGTLSFAGSGKNSRSCHFFIALEHQAHNLGKAPHETPIGEVHWESHDRVRALEMKYLDKGYGDLTHLQSELKEKGNKGVEKLYPNIPVIKTCYHKKTWDHKAHHAWTQPDEDAVHVHKCSKCGHTFDADEDGMGHPFTAMGNAWKCPKCGAPKSAFERFDEQGKPKPDHEHDVADYMRTHDYQHKRHKVEDL